MVMVWEQWYVYTFCFVVFPLIREGRGMLLFPLKGLWGLLGPNPIHSMGIGQDELPAHRRTRTDGSGCHTRCHLHIRSNSIVLKDTSTCSSALPSGARIWPDLWPSDHQSTSSTHWATAVYTYCNLICVHIVSYITYKLTYFNPNHDTF